MAIKVVAIDIDGTLVDERLEISPRVRRAIGAARAAGVRVILATGRRYITAKPFVEPLGLEGPMIVSGGAVICEASTGEILREETISPESLPLAADLVLEAGLQPLVWGSGSASPMLHVGPARFDNEPTAVYVSRQPSVRRMEHEHLRNVARVALVLALTHDEGLLRRLVDAVDELPDLTARLMQAGPGTLPSLGMDVFSGGTGKGSAMRHLASQLGFDLAEVMAIGDATNDLDLLECVGLPIAMGNAVDELMAVASTVVASVQQDGVAEAIERFVL